jgi:hypothetical protein
MISDDNKSLFWGTVIGACLMATAIYVFPRVEPNAPDTMLRTLILNSATGVSRTVVLCWALRYLDGATEGRWAKTISENAYAACAVYLGLIWAVVTGMRIL